MICKRRLHRLHRRKRRCGAHAAHFKKAPACGESGPCSSFPQNYTLDDALETMWRRDISDLPVYKDAFRLAPRMRLTEHQTRGACSE